MSSFDPQFPSIAATFVDSIRALRVFAERIGRYADEHDRQAGEELAASLDRLVNGALLNSDAVAKPDIAVEKVDGGRTEDSKEPEPALDPELSEAVSRMLGDPVRRDAFFGAIRTFRRAAPRQGLTLRRSAVVALSSHLEALVADLIHAYYGLFPGALPADERSLTLAELRELGSVDEAQAHLVTLEVDSVLRESFPKQLEYFAKRPKIDIAAFDRWLEELKEIDLRRNIYVHNRGVVNKRYLRQVSDELQATHEAKEGEELLSSEAYLLAAIDTIFIAGVALIQLCWRKWHRATLDDADSMLIDALFDNLTESRYRVVERIAILAADFKYSTDENRRIIVINQAIALRDMDRREEMAALVAKEDWSSCGPQFRLALAALSGDGERFWEILPKAVAADGITEAQLREWPLFQNLRTHQDFDARVSKLQFPAREPDGDKPPTQLGDGTSPTAV